MAQCEQCGHDLGTGRFCGSCGHAAAASLRDGRTDTAERPKVPAQPGEPPAPRPAPPVFEAPPAPRFPLYADELGPAGAPSSAPTTPTTAPATAPADDDPDAVRRRPAWVPWVAVGSGLVVVALIGALLLTTGGDDTADDPGPNDDAAAGAPSAGTPSGSADPTAPPSSTPSAESPSRDPKPDKPVKPVDVTRSVSAKVPATAAPGRDVDNNVVRYVAANLLDGEASTCWRMPGDAAGDEIVLKLDERTEITRLGLVNGYAKVDPQYDGYFANRRITKVTWILGDGATITQRLRETRRMQTIDVDPVTTRKIRLRIDDVTAPARGKQGRDYTAISDLELVGAPAGR